jgi:ABC-type phosphate transport system auxiliary subunit
LSNRCSPGHPKPTPLRDHRPFAPGEPWVWLTAAGLTLGVAMALGLFLLILVKGAGRSGPGAST